MKQAIIRAIDHFCTTILESSIEEGCCHGEDFFGASVSIFENECEQIWYLFFTKETLNDIARNLLFEENLLEDDLNDLLKEVSNQIIGTAKVFLEEFYPEKDYTLSVPEFMGNICKPFPIPLQEEYVYTINNQTLVVAC